MKQPKTIKVLPGSEKTLYNLPDTPIRCKIQEREPSDDSKIVYITNPKYVKDSKDPVTAAPYLAFTHTEYEVVEWTE